MIDDCVFGVSKWSACHDSRRNDTSASSNGSSPVAYASDRISAHHVRELITNNVKHHVPNIVAKRGERLFSSICSTELLPSF